MSAVIAIFNRHLAPVTRENINAMLKARPERGPNGQSATLLGYVGLGRQHFCITPEERDEVSPLRRGGCTISCDVRLDNRSDLIRTLDLSSYDIDKLSDAALILHSYLKWGTDCLEHLLGDFAFVLWDERKLHLFIARDALGARDLCYVIDKDLCLVASEISQLLAHPHIFPQMNENRIAAFLGMLCDKPEETFYKNIHYLPPAHAMVVTSESLQQWRYWDVDPQVRILYGDDREYSDNYLELLRESVRCRLRSVGEIGISLSGGLDSSTLAALATPMLPPGLRSFSYAFDELQSCDERRYIRSLVERFQLSAEYIPCDDKWPLKNLQNWPVSRDYVLADPYVWLPDAVMNAASKSGVRLLLAGYFGDVLPSGGAYWALGMLQQQHFGRLAKTILKNHAEISWKRDLLHHGLRQLVPHSLVGVFRSVRPKSATSVAPGIDFELLARTDLQERLAAEQVYDKFTAPAQWQRYHSLTLSIFSQGLSATRHYYNRHGLEVVLPYFDRRLVEYVMAVPPQQLGLPGWYRKIHRDAMQGLLPEKVRCRRQRTVFLPLLLKGLRDMEHETVKKILADPQVVARGFVREDWLQQQLQLDYSSSPASMMLWRTISLELWLQRYWS